MTEAGFLKTNFKQIRLTQPDIYALLRTTASTVSANILSQRAKDGSIILVIDDLFQDSGHFPLKNAQHFVDKAIEPDENISYFYFGLGSPLTLRMLLQKGITVTVYENRLPVILNALDLFDFSQSIKQGRLIFLTASQLAVLTPPAKSKLLIHPPSGRALKIQLIRLQNFLNNCDQKYLPKDRPPQILIVGPLSGGSLSMGPSLLSAGRILGLKTQLLVWDEGLIKAAQDTNSLDDRSFGRLMADCGRVISEKMESFQPDLALFLAQAPVTCETISDIRNRCQAIMGFWFVEDRELFRYVDELAPAFDLFFHIQGPEMDQTAKSWGLKRAFYLPMAADPEIFYPQAPVPQNFRAQVSFMGAGYPNRRAIISQLLRNYWLKSGRSAKDFKIFGSGWDQAGPPLSQHLFEGGRRVTTQECALIYSGSRLNLNIHSSLEMGFNPKSAFVNPRTFELASSGGFQIVDYRPLLGELFSKHQVAVVHDPAELPDKIEYYLTHPEIMESMAESSRTTALAEHQYTHRLKFILQCAQDPRHN